MPAHKKDPKDILKRRTVTLTDNDWNWLHLVASKKGITACELVREILKFYQNKRADW